MAPLRRYLRISPYSVLEVRIYLDDPAIVQSWFLNSRNPVLPRVIRAVQPLVIPKLREERERAKGKGKKAKGVKDVVSDDDFEVSVFLSDTSSRHSLLVKQKSIHPKPERIESNSKKLTSWLVGSDEHPMSVEDETEIMIREESDDEMPHFQDFPEVGKDMDSITSRQNISQTLGKRRRTANNQVQVLDEADEPRENIAAMDTPGSMLDKEVQEEGANDNDNKKKLALNTSYDGFSIYGKTLCLVVKRKGGTGKISGAPVNDLGEQLLENWVSSQAAQDQVIDD